MSYKLLVRREGVWQEVGFRHLTLEGAREEAATIWQGYAFLVLPE
jgi:hypothetical protein